MKKQKLEDVLNLKKETISILNTKEMNKAQGGFLSISGCTYKASCRPCDPPPTGGSGGVA